ncbi:MAG: metallophosphoesterase [Candidatus Aenigmatarchaeota archaeon]
MIIAAVSDVHSPQYFSEYVRAIDWMKVKPDLFLIVGDMVHRGDLPEYQKVYNVLFGKITCPIVACFGNNEFQQLRDQLKLRYADIKFLDDETVVLDIGGRSVGIIGTTGCLETATPWQKANIPNIQQIFESRIMFVEKYLQRLQVDFKIVLTHYAPTFKTLEGGNPRFFSTQGNQILEQVVVNNKANLVLHGHSHRGIKMAWADSVPIYNVAFPVNKEIVIIDTDKDLKPGISRFV